MARKKRVNTKKKQSKQSIPPTKSPSDESEPVIKSPMDTKAYSLLQLKNGLKAVLISTCKHECETSKGMINPKTGVFVKVEEFDRKFIGIPDVDGTDVKPDTSVSTSCFEVKGKETDKNDNEERENWEPDKKKPKILENIKGQNCCGPPDEDNMGTVCVVVGAGSIHDPDDFPGLAHLCEHMCADFGSKKYPVSFALDDHIQHCDGEWNAYTYPEVTIYEFQMNLTVSGIDRFKIAVDMLANCLNDPILPADQLHKEVHSLDSEFSLKATTDASKLWGLFYSLADKNHPMSRFIPGNMETLGKPNLHSKLCEWSKRHYAANYMTLAIQAPLPLDKLKEITHESFDGMTSSSKPSPMKELFKRYGNPFNSCFTKFYKFVPTADTNFALISWALPAKFENNFKTKPFKYLSRYFDAGSSFMDYLRDHRLAFDIWPWINSGATTFRSVYSIAISLTDLGVEKIGTVLKALFATLKSVTINEYIFNGIRREYAEKFHQESSMPKGVLEVMHLCCNLQYIEDPKFILASQDLVTEFDKKLIDECFKLLKPRNMNLLVCSKAYENECELVQEFFKTKYRVCDFNEKFLKECENVKIDALLKTPPVENPFLNKCLLCPLRQKDRPPPGPKLRLKNERAIVLCQQKDLCKPGYSPFGMTFLNIESTVDQSSFMGIWFTLLKDQFRKVLFQAQSARILLELTMGGPRLRIYLQGPATHQLTILQSFLSILRRFELTLNEHTFEDYKKEMMKTLDNRSLSPEFFAWDLNKFVLNQTHILSEQRRAELKKIEFQDFKNFLKAFKDRMFISAVIIGCFSEQKILDFVKCIDSMVYRELPEILPIKMCPRAMQLPPGECCLRVKAKSERVHYSFVQNHYQFGILKENEPEIIFNLVRFMNQPSFIQLRTKEQLSYEVNTSVNFYTKAFGLEIIVFPQPHRHSTGFVDERIDAFLASFRKSFSSYKTLTQCSTNACSPNITEEEHKTMLKWFDDYLLPTGQNFRKISIQIVGQPDETKKFEQVQATGIERKIALHKGGSVLIRQRSKLNIVYDVPAVWNFFNSYFIADIETFKNSLWALPCN